MGNSVRGVEFCQKFIKQTNHHYHIFHNIINRESNSNLEKDSADVLTQRLISASSKGNLELVQKLKDKIPFDTPDYDGRTALHLAAAEGHLRVVEYLLKEGCPTNVKDRWGNTPYHEANKLPNNSELLKLLTYNKCY